MLNLNFGKVPNWAFVNVDLFGLWFFTKNSEKWLSALVIVGENNSDVWLSPIAIISRATMTWRSSSSLKGVIL
jgi:hypothetical protein